MVYGVQKANMVCHLARIPLKSFCFANCSAVCAAASQLILNKPLNKL